MILLEQRKVTEAINVVNGPLGNTCKVESERQRILLDLAKTAGRWDDVVSTAEDMLEKQYVTVCMEQLGCFGQIGALTMILVQMIGMLTSITLKEP